MICPECRTELPDEAKFCNECGRKLELVCSECGKGNPPASKFCLECGHNLSIPSEPAPREPTLDEKFASMQKYLPTGLAEKILSQRNKIEGERKQVTVMFCDMAEFTPLVEKLGPEEAYAMMDRVYEILIHKVHDYEGTVNELTGDGIMALFGAPIAVEDAPQRAIRSSLAIHREITRFTDTITHEAGLPRIKMRIGINTGPVVVGTLGNDLRVDFKAVGDTVNLASRMEGLAEAGSTYVTEDTFKLAEGFFRFESLGEKEVKGKDKPLKVYRVIAPSSRRTRFEVSAERGLTPLVARGRELEVMLDDFEQSKGGNGKALSIASEAGVGKSRLLYEFRKAVSNENITFLEGKCLSYGRGIAYHPIIDILKGNFLVLDGDTDQEIREKVRKGLEVLGMDETSTLPYFLELLSVKESGIEKLPISPEARKERIIEALKTIVLKGAEKRHLVIAIEDLHWIDESSEEVLKHLLVSIPGARVLLIFTYRLEFMPKWGVKSYHTQLNLNRFSERDSRVMVTHILHTEQFERDLEQLILDQTEGIPLFIEEFVKALGELKIIEKRNGTCHLAKNVDKMIIPSTIQEIIMSRVDALPEGARKVLQTGAVIEREFSYELIRRVTGLLERELLSHMSVLKDSELIYERGIFPQSSYIFKHALTRDAVYDSILSNRKKRLHEQIAFAMEELYEESLDQHYGTLAEHYAAAENYESAAQYYGLAAQKAEKTASMSDAITHAKKAVACLEKLPLTDEVQREIIEARTGLGLYVTQVFHYDEAKEAVDPIFDLAMKRGAKERLPQLLSIVGTYEFCFEENVETGVEHLKEAVTISEELGDPVSLAFASWRLGLAYSFNVEFQRATHCFEKALSICVAANNLWAISRMKSYLSWFSYFLAGRVDTAYKCSTEAIRIGEDSGDIYSKAMAHVAHGISSFGKALLAEAITYLLKGVEFCQAADLHMWEAVGELYWGELCIEAGEYASSEDHYKKAMSLFKRGFPSLLGLTEIGRAMARMMITALDTDLESSFNHWHENKLKFCEAWKLRYLGEILLNVGDQDKWKAQVWIEKAIDAAARNGMRLELARSHALYAEFFKRKGDLPKAREQLSKAIEIFKDCGADGWVTKCEDELAKLC